MDRTTRRPSGYDCGVYVLLLHLRGPVRLRIGALGVHFLEAGWYAYTGSARRNLRARLTRHLAPQKRKRWHIDYLTTAANARPLAALVVPGHNLPECSLNALVGERFGWSAPLPGFGAGDCRAGCPAHLWYSPGEIELSGLQGLHSDAIVWKSALPDRHAARDRRFH